MTNYLGQLDSIVFYSGSNGQLYPSPAGVSRGQPGYSQLWYVNIGGNSHNRPKGSRGLEKIESVVAQIAPAYTGFIFVIEIDWSSVSDNCCRAVYIVLQVPFSNSPLIDSKALRLVIRLFPFSIQISCDGDNDSIVPHHRNGKPFFALRIEVIRESK